MNERTTEEPREQSNEKPMDAAALAAEQARSSSIARPGGDTVLTSLPLLLSIVALLLSAYALYLTQREAGGDGRLQSLMVRVNGIEANLSQLSKRMEENEADSHERAQIVVRSELDLIAAALSRIEPLASGADRQAILEMRRALDARSNASLSAPAHSSVESVPLGG